mgnify:FL=1
MGWQRDGRPDEDDVRDVFVRLYDEHAADLVRWFASRTYSAEVSADLCAETYAVAIEQYHRFDPARGEAGAWLWGIARNLLRSFHRTGAVEHRARARLSMRTPAIHEDDLDVILDRIDAELRAADLLAAIDELPAATAAAVRARVVERRTYDEVASACGCSVGAARVRVSRGLSALFDRLDRTAPEAQR